MKVELEIVKLSDEDVVTVSVGGGESGGQGGACTIPGTAIDECDPDAE